MKTLFLVFCSIISIQTFAQMNATAEQYLSQNRTIQLNGQNQFVSVLQTLQVPYRSRLNTLFILASTAGGHGTIDIQMNGRSILQRKIGTMFESIQIPINAELGTTLRSLDIITNGSFKIAHLAVSLQKEMLLPPQPPQPPRPPQPPQPPRPPPYNGEEVVFTEKIEGMTFTASIADPNNAARTSYEQKCSVWKEEMSRLIPRILQIDCGQAIASTDPYKFQYRSEGRVSVMAPRDRQRFTSVITGKAFNADKVQNAKERALESYEQNCKAYKAEMLSLNPGRLVFVSCDAPIHSGTNILNKFQSEVSVTVTGVGQSSTINETLLGEIIPGTQSDANQLALESLNRRCDEWKSTMKRHHGVRIVSLNCGLPVSVGGFVQYRYQSQATAILSQFN